MTDNFDKLKEALQSDPPPPGPDAKVLALARAMEGFAKKHEHSPRNGRRDAS